MKNLILSLIVMLSISLYLNAAESNDNAINQTIFRCSEISSNKTRLECFDELVDRISVDKSKARTELASSTSTTREPLEKKDSLQTLSKPNQASNKSDDNFGRKLESNSSINSRIKGEFKKWVKGQRIHLENGQIWEVKRAQSGYKKMQNPKITISVGYLGSFTAKIEGLNATAKVRRIK